jgi:hypothetical protein
MSLSSYSSSARSERANTSTIVCRRRVSASGAGWLGALVEARVFERLLGLAFAALVVRLVFFLVAIPDHPIAVRSK